MYAISNASRVYITSFFLLCVAFFLAPSVANANEYWSVLEKRWIPADQTPNAVKEMLGHKVSRPSGSTITAVPSAPTITKNAAGGLSASTNQILKTLDQPSNFTATSNYSVGAAKNALKSCVRSPACVGRAFGSGAIIYEGIRGWQNVYSYIYDDETGQIKKPIPYDEAPWVLPPPIHNPDYETERNHASWGASYTPNCSSTNTRIVLSCGVEGDRFVRISCPPFYNGSPFAGYNPSTLMCQYAYDQPWEREIPYIPVPLYELDQSIDNSYDPFVSDAPIVLLSGDPETISLSTPAPADLPATTTTNTDSQGKTTTTVKNSAITYNIINNNSSNPSIESTVTETSNTYDDTANLVGSMTSTTTNNAVAPDPLPPSSPSAGASVDFELPAFCTWAKPLCDWLGWTQEELGEEDPDLSQLITVFEPDEDGYDVGIGSGSCPAPMQLNLGIINKTVEVKYDPFCDFLEMIRPFVLAAAYLFAAYLYLGVLRRG